MHYVIEMSFLGCIESSADVDAPQLLAHLLPRWVAVEERFGPPSVATCLELEAGLLPRAVKRRRAEFAAGRQCAHAACRRLGRTTNFIGIHADRSPEWPGGIAGSITHCEGFVAAAAVLAAESTWLGIDAEPAAPLPEGVASRIAFGAERAWIDQGAGPVRDRVLFCIKEAVFKAWWPVRRIWLDFEDVAVTVSSNADSFTAQVAQVPGEVLRLHGRCMVAHGLAAAVVCVAAGS